MKSYGLRPNAITYNALIDVCCKVGDLQRAEATVQVMRAEGHQPDAITFNLLLNACCKLQHRTIACSTTWSRCASLGLLPSAATISMLATNFTGDRTALEQALRSMQEQAAMLPEQQQGGQPPQPPR